MRMETIMKVFMAVVVAVLVAGIAGTRGEAGEKEIKYSLAIYHFNLEYVAGDREIEDKIITESLDPMLDFFLDHPDWGADFEMQGYMVAKTWERFPEIFDKLNKLVDRDQISLVSFHYSDQLFLAYPRLDMEWSDRINKGVFERYGLEQAGAVFAQEGQFGEGMADFMADHGFKTLVLPKNLYRYAHGEQEAMPYYGLNGVYVILGGRGVEYSRDGVEVKVDWSYLGDAELLPTGETPYAETFSYKPSQLEEYEERLQRMVDQGYIIGTIDNYIAALEDAGVEPAKLKPMIDGDWQPDDTENIFRWMGNYLGSHERDNEILTQNVAVRHRLAAAGALVDYLGDKDYNTLGIRQELEDAWRMQCHAEVSDSTGWTPFPIEIDYARKYSLKAEDGVDEIAWLAKEFMDTEYIRVDTGAGTVAALDELPAEKEYPEVECPVDFELTGEIKRQRSRCFDEGNGAVRLELQFETAMSWKNDVRLAFPRTADYLLFSPSLDDNSYVKYGIDEFSPHTDEFYLPSSNGLIALGGNLFLIKKTDTVHVAWRFSFVEDEVSLDMKKPPSKVNTWVLYFFMGEASDALDLANRINVKPGVIF